MTTTTLAAAVALAAMTLPMTAIALPAAPHAVTSATPSITHQIADYDYDGDRGWHHRRSGWRHGHRHGDRGFGRCRSWRHECADRWDWGSRRFYRCLWRHGC